MSNNLTIWLECYRNYNSDGMIEHKDLIAGFDLNCTWEQLP